MPGLEEAGRGVRILDTINNTWSGRGGKRCEDIGYD
jgi:hypothetical protein